MKNKTYQDALTVIQAGLQRAYELGNSAMVRIFLAMLMLLQLSGARLHAQTFSGSDPSQFGDAAVTDIQNAYSYVIPILGTACVAAGIFIIYKWIRKSMGKA